MSFEKVEGYSSLRKDTVNGGVVNVDTKSFEAYKNKRLIALQKNAQEEQTMNSVSKLQTEINNIKSDMQDIKVMLQALIEKGK
jgi:flagellar basal body rod protein FlgB